MQLIKELEKQVGELSQEVEEARQKSQRDEEELAKLRAYKKEIGGPLKILKQADVGP